MVKILAGIVLAILSVFPLSVQSPVGPHAAVLGTATAASPLSVDLWFPLNTSSPGTTLTTTILNNSYVSSQSPTFTLAPATPTGYTVGISQSACAMKSPIKVNGTTYPIGSTEHSFSLVDNADTAWTAVFASGQTESTTIAGCITIGPPTSGFHLYDYVSIYDALGGYAVFPQLSNGAGSNYRVQIETNPGNTTTHDGNVTVTSGSTYWFVLNMNESTGFATAALYNNATGAQVGSTFSVACTTGNTAYKIVVGNNESGSDSNTTYFQNLVVSLSGTYPLGP